MGGHTFVGDELERETAQSYIDLVYETKDGYISVAVVADKDWRGTSEALNRPDFLTDPRFKTAALREDNKDARTQLTQEALLSFTSSDAIARLEQHDVPCAPVLTRKEMIRHPQIEANQTLLGYQHPQAGELRQARQPATFSAMPLASPSAAPQLGEHTSEVLKEAGYSDADIQKLTESHAIISHGNDS